MFFYDVLTEENLCQEIDDICDSDSNAYPFERKAARLNSALDSYLQLAWSVNRSRSFDDTNQSTIPLEQQNIVSGTNYFKISDFTVKLIGFAEVTVLDSDGVPTKLTPEYYTELYDNFEELYGSYGASLTTGVPSHYCVVGDRLYLRPTPDYSETSGLKVYGIRASSKFQFQRCTILEANPGVVTDTAHGLSANDTVILRTTGALPTNLSADTLYYLVSTVGDDVFSLATTRGGTAIDTSGSAESGEHAYIQANKTPGIPPIYDHYMYLARKASLPYLLDKGKKNARDMAAMIAMDEAKIKEYFASKDNDDDNRITFRQRIFE